MAKDRSTPDEKKAIIRNTVIATKKISEMPRNPNWRFDPKHIEAVKEGILRICSDYGMIPTINYMAMALGVSKNTEISARTGVTTCDAGVVEALQEYARICESVTLQTALDGTANNIAGIFSLKSLYGYRDEPKEIVVTHNFNGLLGDRKDPHEIAQRYAEAVVIDVEPSEIRYLEQEEQDADGNE